MFMEYFIITLLESEMRKVNKNISKPLWSLVYEAYYYTDYVSDRERNLRLSCEDVELPSNFSKKVVSVRPTDNAKRKTIYCSISPKVASYVNLTILIFYFLCYNNSKTLKLIFIFVLSF